MAEPLPNLTDDEAVDGLTDSDVGDAEEETSDYGTEDQEHVSDPSEGEESDGVVMSDVSVDDSEEEDGDGEGEEIMEDALACDESDAVREEGTALFKEKKVRKLSQFDQVARINLGLPEYPGIWEKIAQITPGFL